MCIRFFIKYMQSQFFVNFDFDLNLIIHISLSVLRFAIKKKRNIFYQEICHIQNQTLAIYS